MINKPSDLDRRIFLKVQMCYDAAVVLNDDEEDQKFTDLVREVFDKLDLKEPDKEKILLSAHNLMLERGSDKQQIGLFLALLEKTINRHSQVQIRRQELLELLKADFSSEIEDLAYDIRQLEVGSTQAATDIIQEYYDQETDHDPQETAFATSYIRSIAIPEKDYTYTEEYVEQAAQVLHVSRQIVTDLIAWKKDKKGDPGKTFTRLIGSIRKKLGIRPPQKKREEKTTKPEEKNGDNQESTPARSKVDTSYSFISDEAKAKIAAHYEPDFEFDEKYGFTEEQLKWIYALFLFGPEEEEGRIELRKHLADNIFHCSTPKMATVTAYLSPQFLQVAEQKNGQIRHFLKEIMEQASPKQKPKEDQEDQIPQVQRPAKPPKAKRPKKEVPKSEPIQITREELKDTDDNNEDRLIGWRYPINKMIMTAWGKRNPLRGKRMLLVESPELREWRMLERMGAEQSLLTIVEKDEVQAAKMQELLPKATVVASDFENWLVSTASRRLKGREEEMKRKQIPTDGSGRLKDYLCDDSRTPIEAENRTFNVANRIDFEYADDEAFDLLSLDTEVTFPELDDWLSLALRLGLIRDKGVLATSVVGDYYWQVGCTCLEYKPLSISDGIANNLVSGMNCGEVKLFKNHDSPLFKAAFGDVAWGEEELQKVLNAEMARRGVCSSSMARCNSKKEGQHLMDTIWFPRILERYFELRCRRVFAPLYRKLTHGERRKMDTYYDQLMSVTSARDALGDQITQYRQTIELKDSLGAGVSSSIYHHKAQGNSIRNHESYRYLDPENKVMYSDFFHVKRVSAMVDPAGQLSRLLNAVITGKTPNIKPSTLIRIAKRHSKISREEKRIRSCFERKAV